MTAQPYWRDKPWTLHKRGDEYRIYSGALPVVIADVDFHIEAARHAVQCVNAHDALVEALGRVPADHAYSCRWDPTDDYACDCHVGAVRRALDLAKREVVVK